MNAEPDQPIIMRPHPAGWIGGMFVTALIGALGIFMAGAAIFAMVTWHLGVGIFLLLIAGFQGVLFRYVLRDMRGKRGWRITIGADVLDLDLPSGRSLIHRLGPVRAQIRYDDIEAVETRLEAYRSFGLANMHRSYALRLQTGGLIILGEDRALGTSMASTFFADTVEQILRRGALKMCDLGMAEGQGGILSVLFTAPPPWDAPSLGAEMQTALWNRVTLTGWLVGLGVMAVLFAAALSLLS